jgi:hypothetical protein
MVEIKRIVEFTDFETMERFFRYRRDVISIRSSGTGCIVVRFATTPIDDEEDPTGNILISVAGSSFSLRSGK